MRVLAFVAISVFSSLSIADYDDDPYTRKTMTEKFDRSSSSVTIRHRLFRVKVDGKEMTQTIGISHESMDMEQPRIIVRLYNCKRDKFPASIVRDVYDQNPPPVEIDQYLIFAWSHDIKDLPFLPINWRE
jgi:hypothetical protein